MSDQLDPSVSEFATQEQADRHDRWFRAKVQHSLDNPGQGQPHDHVMARADAIIENASVVHARQHYP
ncbi:stability determinant [Halomonas sp. 18H]|uniref:type II toxin-antitoxin system RelB family antitoxin n=1 Tax=Halomonas almeriensis TaxID=308163 RepID=UPI00222F3935|nr:MULTISPECIES: stability determinant [Halomonas]MCW4149778.1 stability determinant [Halomonas sp. 18H]MDN3553261.1 stability determinant [Halomonas almeriensis]